MIPCVVHLGVEMARPLGAPSQVGHQCRRPPGQELAAHVPRRWIKNKIKILLPIYLTIVIIAYY